jgi:hypothetical protein
MHAKFHKDRFRHSEVDGGDKNWGSIVGVATGFGLDDRGVGVRVPVGSRMFSKSRPVLGSTQPPMQWVPRAFSPAVRRPGREADHPSPANAELKKMWIYTSTPSYAFMVWCLIR